MRNICRLDTCDKLVHSHKLCNTHLKRYRRKGNFDEKVIWKGRPCTIVDCEKPIKSSRMCVMHYSRLLRTGEPGSAVSYRRGGSKQHPLISVYDNMKKRCYNTNCLYYKNYGGRGIKVCDRWLESFWNFVEDMPDRTSLDHQLDRIDNNGDYSAENCRWATRREQGLNKRSNRLLTYLGDTMTLTEWSEITGIHRATLADRIDKLGWSISDALTKQTRAQTKTKA